MAFCLDAAARYMAALCAYVWANLPPITEPPTNAEPTVDAGERFIALPKMVVAAAPRVTADNPAAAPLIPITPLIAFPKEVIRPIN